MTEPFQCSDCGQLIQFHEGLNRVVNTGRGAGGDIGNDHICPERLGSKYHHYVKFEKHQQELICHCSDCGFPHYQVMRCPMCFNRDREFIGKLTDKKYLKEYLIQWKVIKHNLWIVSPDTGTFTLVGDIHEPKVWIHFAKIQRDLLNILNVGAMEQKELGEPLS